MFTYFLFAVGRADCVTKAGEHFGASRGIDEAYWFSISWRYFFGGLAKKYRRNSDNILEMRDCHVCILRVSLKPL